MKFPLQFVYKFQSKQFHINTLVVNNIAVCCIDAVAIGEGGGWGVAIVD